MAESENVVQVQLIRAQELNLNLPMQHSGKLYGIYCIEVPHQLKRNPGGTINMAEE